MLKSIDRLQASEELDFYTSTAWKPEKEGGINYGKVFDDLGN
jgi:hypothetical protein